MKVTLEGEGQTKVELKWDPVGKASPFEDKRQDKFVDDVVRLACMMAMNERMYIEAKGK